MFTTIEVPGFLKIKQANKVFGIGLNTLYEAVRTEDLPAYHPNGRDILLKASDIVAWIEKHKYKACKNNQQLG